MPLVLAAIDLKLSPSRAETASRQRRLDSLKKIIRHSESLYDVTDFVAAGTNHILQLAYLTTQNFFLPTDISSTKRKTSEIYDSVRCNNVHRSNIFKRSLSPDQTRARNWLDAFILCPRAYLLISTSVDYSLSVGRLPYENSLPALVRGISYQFSKSRLPWSLDDKSHTSSPQSRGNQGLGSMDPRSVVSDDNYSWAGKSAMESSDEDSNLDNESSIEELNTGHQVNPIKRSNQEAHDMSSSLVNLDFFEIGPDPKPHSMAREPSMWALPEIEDACSLSFDASQLLSCQPKDDIGNTIDVASEMDDFDWISFYSLFHGQSDSESYV